MSILLKVRYCRYIEHYDHHYMQVRTSHLYFNFWSALSYYSAHLVSNRNFNLSFKIDNHIIMYSLKFHQGHIMLLILLH